MRASTRAWMTMMVLTALGMAALALGLNRPMPLFWLAFLAAMTLIKGCLILLDFLELRGAGKWRRAFVSGYFAATGLVGALLALSHH